LLYKGVAAAPESAETGGVAALKINGQVIPTCNGESLDAIGSSIQSAVDGIETVFRSFDKDESGTIEINELSALSQELNHELSEQELQIAFNDIDVDQDGKISLEEFVNWWKKGRKGKSAVVKKLTSLNMKAQNFTRQL
jgi:hypothetical protein